MMFMRRLRYMFSGRIIRGIFAIVSSAFVIIFVCLLAFGVINQRSVFDWVFKKSNEGGQKVSDMIMDTIEGSQNAPVVFTDQGVYLRGYQPDGAENLESGSFIGDMKDEYVEPIREAIEGDPADVNRDPEEDEGEEAPDKESEDGGMEDENQTGE